MKYFIFTIGCQMNENDSEKLAAVLEKNGFKAASSEKEADLIFANLCSVRQKGIDRIWGKLKVWQKFAKKPKIYLTGCILEKDRQAFAARVDGIFKISSIGKLPTLLKKKNFSSNLTFADSLAYLEILPKRAKKNIAYVPIMTGCNNFCSYCAVPFTRGREVSRAKSKILAEIKSIVKEGGKNIMLLGQNVNSYNPTNRPRTNFDNADFIDLLLSIDKLPGDFEFSFISSNPHDMSDKLIKTFADLRKWDKTLHVAMQSGDDEILKKMNRKLTSAQFLNKIAKIKKSVPDIYLTTDIIVGFPGETKKAFLNTVKVCKKVQFKKAYVNQYSPRADTLSAKWEDSVLREEKKRRWQILNDLING